MSPHNSGPANVDPEKEAGEDFDRVWEATEAVFDMQPGEKRDLLQHMGYEPETIMRYIGSHNATEMSESGDRESSDITHAVMLLALNVIERQELFTGTYEIPRSQALAMLKAEYDHQQKRRSGGKSAEPPSP
jgi:hypothetical protein